MQADIFFRNLTSFIDGGFVLVCRPSPLCPHVRVVCLKCFDVVEDRAASRGTIQDGYSTFLWNFGKFITVYAASRPRREQSWVWFCVFSLKCSSYNFVHGLSGNKNRCVTEGHWLTLKRQNLEYSRRRRRRRRRRRKRRRGRTKSWACLEVKLRANCSRGRLSHPCCLPFSKFHEISNKEVSLYLALEKWYGLGNEASEQGGD